MIADTVREIVRKRVARSLPADALSDETRLGSEGLGLDSIAIAEVLLECEERFGVDVSHLLQSAPLTLGRVVASLEQNAR